MTEQSLRHGNKSRNKWVMCPTCRQHTDVGNIALADDRQISPNSVILNTIQGGDNCEASVTVQGSYGTKVHFPSVLFCSFSILLYFFHGIKQLTWNNCI